tara:strand:- start:3661 stop:4398 length:738 start_codon:yes stop_codon:yes gene_type:complete
MPIVYLNKNIGETPKELIDKYKQANGVKKASYCGRLDPMASGLMIVLTEEDCKLQNKFQSTSKTYKFNIIVGISTDSHDPLNDNIKLYKEYINLDELTELISKKYNGKIKQNYPLCSSYAIDVGFHKKIPLWEAFKNKIITTDYDLPYKFINVSNFKVLESKIINDNDLFDEFMSDINKVSDINDNFGKKEALEFYSNKKNNNYQVISCQVSGSSGTYVRGLVRDIGKDLNKNCIVHRISRISIY